MTSFRQMLSKLYSRFLGKTGDDDEVTITFSPIPGQAHALYGLKKSKLADNSKGLQPKFTIESDDSSCDSDDDIQIDLEESFKVVAFLYANDSSFSVMGGVRRIWRALILSPLISCVSII